MGLLERVFGHPEGLLGRVGGWIMAQTNQATAAWALDLLDIRPDDAVLEVGFGPGVGIEIAAAQATDGLVAGIDPSEAMIDAARERNREALDAGRVELRLGQAEDLPWPSGRFDKVLAVNTLPLWDDPDQGLAEIRRVLGDEGTVAIAFTPRFVDSADGVPDQLTRAGFQRARRLAGEDGVCVLANPVPTDDAKR